MRRRTDLHTEAGIIRHIEKGRGGGTGVNYKPWLTVHDVPSSGYRTMVYSVRLKRTIHLLSLLELGAFVVAEANPKVVEIYEQFPLDRVLTRYIAKLLGVTHPRIFGTDIVMTSDLRLLKEEPSGRLRWTVWSSKYSDELRKWRPAEKLAIEKSLQAALGEGFEIITEESFPRALIMNLRMLRTMQRPGVIDGYTREILDAVKEYLEPRMWTEPFADLCGDCDKYLNLPKGLTALRAAYAIIGRWEWRVDLRYAIEPHVPLRRLHE